MDKIDTFVRQIKSRSEEHRKAVAALEDISAHGQIAAILRQELDSMVRVIYLLSIPLDQRLKLISDATEGIKWRKEGSRSAITDKEMIELSQKLSGWTRSVYKFGCAFIHLSSFHDYENRNPIAQLPDNERLDLISHCRYYHGGPINDDPTFHDFIPYLPRVFDKIASNLEFYLDELISRKPPSLEI
jgi:hypothetical protein